MQCTTARRAQWVHHCCAQWVHLQAEKLQDLERRNKEMSQTAETLQRRNSELAGEKKALGEDLTVQLEVTVCAVCPDGCYSVCCVP